MKRARFLLLAAVSALISFPGGTAARVHAHSRWTTRVQAVPGENATCVITRHATRTVQPARGRAYLEDLYRQERGPCV